MTVTEFSDGDAMVQIRDGFIRLTDVKTGESIVHHSQYRTMWTFDALTDQVYAVDDGTRHAVVLPRRRWPLRGRR